MSFSFCSHNIKPLSSGSGSNGTSISCKARTDKSTEEQTSKSKRWLLRQSIRGELKVSGPFSSVRQSPFAESSGLWCGGSPRGSVAARGRGARCLVTRGPVRRGCVEACGKTPEGPPAAVASSWPAPKSASIGVHLRLALCCA
jgi:hypothetical protein